VFGFLHQATFSPSARQSAQPAQQGIAAGNDVLNWAELIVSVGLGGIARSEIDCRDAHRAEACDIGPSELGTSVTADRPEKFSGSRLVEAGSGTGGYINDRTE
jgi:hypothetical protein